MCHLWPSPSPQTSSGFFCYVRLKIFKFASTWCSLKKSYF
jgi:hypothetical protein